MSESIYYQNSHLLRPRLLETISLFAPVGDVSSSLDAPTAHTGSASNLNSATPTIENSQAGERDLGEFFSDRRMNYNRRVAIALVAGFVAVKRIATTKDIAEAIDLNSQERRYALGFLSRSLAAEYRTTEPQPTHTLLFRTLSGHYNMAQYEALPALDRLVEQAEEYYPLLHDAAAHFRLNDNS